MNEILLSIGGGTNAWTCAVGMHNSTASDPKRFDISTSPQELEDIRWYVEQFAELPLAGELVRARRIRDSMENIGRRLFEAAFHGRTSEIEAVLRGTERPTITMSSDSYQIHQLPWELLADSGGFISARDILIRRTFGNQETLSSATTQVHLRILMVVSRPDELPVIDSRHNLTLLSVLAESAVSRADVTLCLPATYARLVQLVDEAHRAGSPFTIIHFDGHGGFDEFRDRGYLCFETDISSTNSTLVDQVSAKAFANVVAHCGGQRQLFFPTDDN